MFQFRGQSLKSRTAYFNELLIEENLVLSFAPIPFTAAIMASAMPAAMRPYSIAVAAVSSARNLRMIFMRCCLRQKPKGTFNLA
jgi:hypothetical protein